MTADPRALIYAVLQKRDEMNQLTARMPILKQPIFRPLNMPMPTFEPAELGFLRTVAYLYVLYFEAARATLDVVISASTAYGHDATSQLKRHPKEVRSLRTMLQHNVDPLAMKNEDVNATCSNWFKRECGSILPGNSDQWHSALVALLTHSVEFCKSMCDVIREVERDEACNDILAEWARRISRYLEPHQFDDLISMAANDIGRTELDPVSVRKRHFHRWSEHLRLLREDADVFCEARKLIEYVLLTDISRRLPIDGRDIMQAMSIGPGVLVGQLLQFARMSYEARPCGREELLERVATNLACVGVEKSGQTTATGGEG